MHHFAASLVIIIYQASKMELRVACIAADPRAHLIADFRPEPIENN